jgi:hypothetical protein
MALSVARLQYPHKAEGEWPKPACGFLYALCFHAPQPVVANFFHYSDRSIFDLRCDLGVRSPKLETVEAAAARFLWHGLAFTTGLRWRPSISRKLCVDNP